MKHRLLAACWPLLVCFSLVSVASLASARTRTAQAPLPPLEGEVIVQFKADASVMRRHALAARATPAAVGDTLTQRAAVLGTRLGRSLQAGAVVGERSQVLRAAGVDTSTLVRELAVDPDVEFVVPNGRRRFVVAPNDPLYAAVPLATRPRGPESGQWYLRAPAGAVASSIDIETAWARTLGSDNVVVALLDTGVRFDHPDLGRAAQGGRLLPGYDFVSNSAVANDGDGRDDDPSDPGDWVSAAEANRGSFNNCSASESSWHGTSTASLVGAAANNNIGMAGAAPGVRVLPVRVLGKCYGVDSDIIAGMRWAAGIAVDGVPNNPNPAKVLNMSLGGSGPCTAAYQNAVNEIIAKGVVIVAAAGNSAGGPVSVPANCTGVIGVTALRHVGTKVGFSDLGPQISIAAPGGNCVNVGTGEACLYPILAATNSGLQGPTTSGWSDGFDITVGTSFSSPLVAATVGLMFSAQPSLTPAQVRGVLQSTARAFPSTGGDNGGDPAPVVQCQAPSADVPQLQCYCNTTFCGAGMLNAGAAVNAVAGLVARVVVSTAVPTAGSPIALSSSTSSAGTGRSIVAWNWQVVNAGGTGASVSSASNAASATLAASAAGTLTLRLTVTDALGDTSSTVRAGNVAAGATPAPVTPAPAPAGGSGGGAMSLPWLLLLGLAVWALWRRSPRPGHDGR